MQENIDLIRRGYEAFNSADLPTLTGLFAERTRWHTPGHSPIAGEFAGRDATFAQFGRYFEGTGGTFRAELRHLTADSDGRVVAIHHNSGMRNGKRLDVDCCIVFQVRDGQAVEGREFFYDLHAWDEFWK